MSDIKWEPWMGKIVAEECNVKTVMIDDVILYDDKIEYRKTKVKNMIIIPDVTDVEVVFGNIAHMPKYEKIPPEFKHISNKYVRFISKWFYEGISAEDANRLVPKEGIDPAKAVRAIKSILVSFAPKHEHKEAGCAFLLSQWFDLKDDL